MPHRDVHLDFNLATETLLGEQGVSFAALERLKPLSEEIHKGLKAMREVGQIPFYRLPYEEEEAARISAVAEDLQDQFDRLVVLGIGGSALGARALIQGCQGEQTRVRICDQLDPDSFGELLASLNLSKTVFNVVSKSGNTLETMSQFLVIQDQLKNKVGKNWTKHVVVTTDPAEGLLRKWVQEKEIRSFAIPPGVGGRYSVLSPVGLFPAAMAGVDIHEVLAGARRSSERCQRENLFENPAYMLAALQFLMNKQGKNILVIMPYSDWLFPLAEWYCQLWAESIGKRFNLKGEKVYTGSTPVAACGPRDQHSQLQLYQEGPPDKLILFLRPREFDKKIPIPWELSQEMGLDFLGRHDLDKVLQAEATATAVALRDEGRPSLDLSYFKRNAYALGQLFFLFEVTTAFAGGLYEVNPFNQPGVELGKKIAAGILGKSGCESYGNPFLRIQKDPRLVI